MFVIMFLVVDVFFSSLIFQSQKTSLEKEETGTYIQEDSLKSNPSENILTISEIEGPRISDQGAYAEKVAVCEDQNISCFSLPGGLWLFLIFSYAAILIFNLAYSFKRTNNTQWFWETFYTLLAVLAWFAWDDCGALNVWYVEFILKTGIVIYGTYLYLFFRRAR